jgi:hypothetical protein
MRISLPSENAANKHRIRQDLTTGGLKNGRDGFDQTMNLCLAGDSGIEKFIRQRFSNSRGILFKYLPKFLGPRPSIPQGTSATLNLLASSLNPPTYLNPSRSFCFE